MKKSLVALSILGSIAVRGYSQNNPPYNEKIIDVINRTIKDKSFKEKDYREYLLSSDVVDGGKAILFFYDFNNNEIPDAAARFEIYEKYSNKHKKRIGVFKKKAEIAIFDREEDNSFESKFIDMDNDGKFDIIIEDKKRDLPKKYITNSRSAV